jgi:hypothetical protein
MSVGSVEFKDRYCLINNGERQDRLEAPTASSILQAVAGMVGAAPEEDRPLGAALVFNGDEP